MNCGSNSTEDSSSPDAAGADDRMSLVAPTGPHGVNACNVCQTSPSVYECCIQDLPGKPLHRRRRHLIQRVTEGTEAYGLCSAMQKLEKAILYSVQYFTLELE